MLKTYHCSLPSLILNLNTSQKTQVMLLTLRAVMVLMVLAPQFWINVLGMTSKAREMAR